MTSKLTITDERIEKIAVWLATESHSLNLEMLTCLRELQERRKADINSEPYGFTDGDRRGMIYEPQYADRLNDPLPVYRHAQPAPASEPVFFIEIEGDDWINAGRIEGKNRPDLGLLPDGINYLYAAPQPAPVVGGEPVAEVLSSRPGNDTSTIDRALPVGTKLYRHAQPAPVVPEKATVGEMPFLGTSEGAYVRGWNDCRAAMLQELQKSAGVSNNCRSSENVQVMQDNGHKWSPWLIHPENCQCIECRSARLNGGKS